MIITPYEYLANKLGNQHAEGYKKLVVKAYLTVVKLIFAGPGFPYLMKGLFAALIGNKKRRNEQFTLGSTTWGNKIVEITNTKIYKSNEIDIPQKGHMIFLNHVNELDFPFDCIIVNKPFLANQTIKSSVFAYWWMSAMGSQVFDTTHQRTISKSVRNLVIGLKDASFIVYPEGRNTYSEEIKPLKKGMIKVAFENKIPIVIILKSGIQRFHEKQNGNTVGYRYVETIEPSKFTSWDSMKEYIFDTMYKEKIKLNQEVDKLNE